MAMATAAMTTVTVTSARSRLACISPSSEALEVLDQVALLSRRQAQSEAAVVVVDHAPERLEPAVVVEAALRVRPQPAQRGGAVHPGRRALGLEIVGADLRRPVQVPTALRELRRDVAGRALALAVEDRLAAPRRGRVEAALRRLRRLQRHLVEVQRR